MKYLEVRTNLSRKIGIAGTLGTIALAPLFAAPAVEAAPRYPESNVGTRSTRSTRNNITLTGIVLRDLTGNDRFSLRASNGRTYEVVSHNREPLRLSRNDRVQVTGYIDRDLFIARRVRILDNNSRGNGGYSVRTTLTGIVTRDLGGDNRFALRTNDGRTYEVVSERREPLRLSRNDRVEVRGYFGRDRNDRDRTGRDRFEDEQFVAEEIRILDDRGGSGGIYQPRGRRGNVDFPGTVVSVHSSNRLTVRGNNGLSYLVESRRDLRRRISRGDRVRVVGVSNGSIIVAQDVVLRNDRDDVDDDSKNISFTGVVRGRVGPNREHLTIKDDDENQVRIVSARNFQSFRIGDRVRVVGVLQRDRSLVIASSITRF